MINLEGEDLLKEKNSSSRFNSSFPSKICFFCSKVLLILHSLDTRILEIPALPFFLFSGTEGLKAFEKL